jgi:hypothetical protein
MNDINKMIKEYVIPFIIVQGIVLLGAWFVCQAWDRESGFNNNIKNYYIKGE